MSWWIGIALLTSASELKPVVVELSQCHQELEQAIAVHRERLPYWLTTADEDIRAVVLGWPTRKSTSETLIAQYEAGSLGAGGVHLLSNGVADCRKTLAQFRLDSFQFIVLVWLGLGVAVALTLCVVLAMFWPFRPWRSKHGSAKPSGSSINEDTDSKRSSSSSTP